MPDNAASLPDDIESLRRLVAAQRSELDAERAARMAAEGALLSRDLLIEKLKVQIARLKRMHFGRSSEKLASEIAQLNLPWWLRRLVAHLDLCNATQPTEVVPNHAWDIGDLWITRQRKIPVCSHGVSIVTRNLQLCRQLWRSEESAVVA